MSARTKVAALGLAVALVFTGAACGSGSDQADDKADEAPSGDRGGEVDIDADDGTVKYTDEDGAETEMNIDGAGVSLPDGWPEGLEIPDSVTLITATTAPVDGKEVLTVLGEASTSIDELLPAVKDRVADAGFEITQDTSSELTGGTFAGITATKGDQTLSVTVSTDPTDPKKVTVSMSVATDA